MTVKNFGIFEGSSFADTYGTTKDTTDVIVGVNALGNDMVLHVRQTQNKDHRRLIRKFQKKLEACERRNDDEGKRKIYAEIAALSLLDGWSGMITKVQATDDDGTPAVDSDGKPIWKTDDDGNLIYVDIEPTPENKVAALKEFKAFSSDVIEAAAEIKNFQDEAEDNVTKN